MLHGQPGSALDWRRVRAQLPPGVPVLAGDRPGYGTNPAPAGGFTANALWVARRLEETEITGPVTMLAHSWGGGVALAFAQLFPERVATIVLAASIGPDCLLPLDRVLAAPVIGPAVVWSAFVTGAPFARRRALRTFGRDPEVERTIAANARRSVWRAFEVEQRAMLDELPEICARLGEVQAPTTVITGAKDRWIPAVTSPALARQIRGARLVRLPRAGHSLPFEAPADLARAVEETIALAPRR